MEHGIVYFPLSVSELSKENTENSPDIFVVAVGDHVVVKQDKNMGFSFTEEKNMKVLQLSQTSEPWKNLV